MFAVGCQKLAKLRDKGARDMNKRNCVLLVCMLLLSSVLGCAQATTSQPAPTPEPTATSEPTATFVAGWEKFEGGGVELWLPETYEGGNPEQDIDVVVENLRKLGPDFERTAQMIEQNPTMFAIWAFDSQVGDSGVLTNVNVTTEKVLSAVTVDTYLDAASKQLPAAFQVVGRDGLSINGHPAGRLTVEFAVSGVAGKEVVYVVKDDTTIWAITYATGADEFDQRLPVFEQSALTFAIQP
jgi:hypothetical protein